MRMESGRDGRVDDVGGWVRRECRTATTAPAAPPHARRRSRPHSVDPPTIEAKAAKGNPRKAGRESPLAHPASLEFDKRRKTTAVAASDRELAAMREESPTARSTLRQSIAILLVSTWLTPPDNAPCLWLLPSS